MPSPTPPGRPRSMRRARGTNKKNQVFSLVALLYPEAAVTTMPACPGLKLTAIGGGVFSPVALPCLEAG